MTSNELQERLIAEIEQIAQDMECLRNGEHLAALKGYPQAIPVMPACRTVPYDETNDQKASLFPYFVVRLDETEYCRPEVDGRSQAHLMVLFAVRDEDYTMKGYFTLSAIMERVVMRFQTDQAMGPFWCEKQMRAAFQDDDTFPHFFGGIEMTWNLPCIETEDIYD